jgi:hypothetical protein
MAFTRTQANNRGKALKSYYQQTPVGGRAAAHDERGAHGTRRWLEARRRGNLSFAAEIVSWRLTEWTHDLRPGVPKAIALKPPADLVGRSVLR